MTDYEREREEFRNSRALVLKARINREWYPGDVMQATRGPLQPKSSPVEWENNQWQQVQQLKGMVNHLQNKVIELQKKRSLEIYGKDIL